MSISLTPQPVACECGFMLHASFAAERAGRCPNCGEMVCHTCGCTETHACARLASTTDGARSVRQVCDWAEPGLCSFCYSEATYCLYMEVTGRTPSDPFYLRTYLPGETHHVSPALEVIRS